MVAIQSFGSTPARSIERMLARLDLRGYDGDLKVALMRAPEANDEHETIAARVAAIIERVRFGGDEALREYTQKFDGVTRQDLRVHADEIQSGLDAIDPDLRMALEFARDQILAYHEGQREHSGRHERNGVHVQELVLPVERAGLYVPGGRAAYPSTVLMTAIPAKIAGVPAVVLCVPPDQSGRVPASTLAAAAIAGVDELYCVGGAQAIAALAYGTESIAAVDVIVGPGNAYVAEAKRQVIGTVGIDSIAGPSEVVVIADGLREAQFVAADLLAQAEHGPGGSAILITWNVSLADEVDRQLDSLARSALRSDDVMSTLGTGGRIIIVDDVRHALEVSNAIAPEHLQLMCSNAAHAVSMVRNAGAVFVGEWAPAAIGDYVAGVNHVLPTGGTARFASALRVSTFQKVVHVVTMDEAALDRVGPYAATIADAEGLDAHAQSLRIRRIPR